MQPLRAQIEKLLKGEEFDGRDKLIALGTSAVPTLIEIAQHDPNVLHRARALDVLGRIGDHQVIPVLSAGLRAQDSLERVAAVQALSEVAGAESVKTLVSLLEEPDPALVKVVLRSLARVGDASALAALERAQREPSSEPLRAEVETAINEIRGRMA